MPVVRRGFGIKGIAKIVLDAEEMKKRPYISVLKLPLVIDIQQKLGVL
jgi:hypothetical protein